MVIGGQDNSSRYSSAYQKGLSDAEALISSTIEELEMWGFGEEPSHKAPSVKASEKVILNLTISQQQAQQISQTINLSQYDAEVQSKVNELLDELKKKSKNKTKIVDAVKWLADKGTDALIAILIAGLHLS